LDNILDIVFAGLIILFGVLAFMRGALREFFSLIGLIAGFLAANRWYFSLSDLIQPLFPSGLSDLAELLSFLVIVFAGYFAGIFLSGFGDLFRSQPSNAMYRMLGGLIGLIKGATFSLVLFWVINFYVPPFRDELAESFLAGQFAKVLALMESLNLI